MTLAIIKYHISKGGKGTKKTRGVKTTISTMLVIPIMLKELCCLTIVLHPAWHKAANKINKKTIEVFKISNCKLSNN
jgi:hypothetical protein